jgi:hypothetical protein
MRMSFLAAAGLLVATPAMAGNALVPANQPVAVGKSLLRVTPDIEWNRLALRPGRNSESWTLDGEELNDLTFYGGLAEDKTLFREVDKRNRPLPHISGTMLITDVPSLLENSYRIALNTPIFAIESMEPAAFGGKPGLRFRYSFTRSGEALARTGEARAALVDGKLYMITYEAPRLHFFEKSVQSFRQIADSAQF